MSEPLYKLLKDFEDPNGKIYAGVRKTEAQWLTRFALMKQGDCELKKDWFKEVEIPIFNSEDVIAFAELIERKQRAHEEFDIHKEFRNFFGKTESYISSDSEYKLS